MATAIAKRKSAEKSTKRAVQSKMDQPEKHQSKYLTVEQAWTDCRKVEASSKPNTKAAMQMQLQIVVELSLLMLSDLSLKELSNRASLSTATLGRFRSGKYTLNVRWGTVQCLSVAAGLRVTHNDSGLRLYVVQ